MTASPERQSTARITALLAALSGFRVHDASPVIEPEMPMFVAYEGLEITPLFGHDNAGAAANRIALAEHTGTHLDAPFHFDRDGATVDEIRPDALFLRPYKEFDLSSPAPEPGQMLGAGERVGVALEPGDVAIVETGWDRHWPAAGGEPAAAGWWGRNEPGFGEDACRWLAEADIATVASDTTGCDVPYGDGEIGHGPGHSSWFLPRCILIVERLRGLAQVGPVGLIVAIALRIRGGTGSPLRVLLLDRDGAG